MDFVPLTGDQRRAFAEDGFLVVPNALDRETVDRLLSVADRLADSFLNKPVVDGKPEYNHLDIRRGLMREKALFDLVTHSTTVPLVVQLLGPNIHLHSTSIIYKRPETGELPAFRRGWHRDLRMARDLGNAGLPLAGLKICYCLTDFPAPNSGMTLMARGSHLHNEPLRVPKGGVDPVDAEVCDPRMNAGDALFFEHRTFHTAAPNLSDRTSKVVIYGYSYRWMRTEVYLETSEVEDLVQTDPIMRQLLGGYRDVDTPPWALERWLKKHGLPREPVRWTTEA